MACSDVGTMERDLLGRRLASPGPVGQSPPAHSVHLSERPGEVWAAWRALFLPYQEGAGGGYKRRVLRLCGNAQGMASDTSLGC